MRCDMAAMLSDDDEEEEAFLDRSELLFLLDGDGDEEEEAFEDKPGGGGVHGFLNGYMLGYGLWAFCL